MQRVGWIILDHIGPVSAQANLQRVAAEATSRKLSLEVDTRRPQNSQRVLQLHTQRGVLQISECHARLGKGNSAPRDKESENLAIAEVQLAARRTRNLCIQVTAYNRQQGAVIHSDYAPRFTAIVTRNGQMTAFCSEAERRTKAQVHLTRRRRRRARRSAMTRSFRCCVRGHWPSRAGTLLAANQRGRFCTHLTMGWRDCPARRCEVAWCRRSLAHRQHWRVRVALDRHTQCK